MTTGVQAEPTRARTRAELRTQAKAFRASDPERLGRVRRAQLAVVLGLGAWWCAGGPLVSLIIAGRLPADRLSTGRIAETALGTLVQNAGLVACVGGCLALVVWNLLTDAARIRPLWPLASTVLLFACVSFSNLAASGDEVRSGSRVALLLAVTVWAIQPTVEDLRVVGTTGVILVAVSVALLPSGKTWMPAADIVLQEKAIIGTQLMAGPFGQSNILGLALAVTMPFVFLFRRPWTRLASFLVVGFFLVLTGSRSTLLGIVASVVLGIIVVAMRGRFLAGVVAVIGVLGLAVGSLWIALTTTDPEAFTQRGSIWMISRATWAATNRTLLFGNGLDYYGIGGHFAVFDHGSPTYHGHNELVSIMTTSGAVTLTAFLLIYGTVVFGALRMTGRGRRTMFLAMFAVLGCGIAETPLRIDTIDSLGWLTWFSLFAAVVAVMGEDREELRRPLVRAESRGRSRGR